MKELNLKKSLVVAGVVAVCMLFADRAVQTAEAHPWGGYRGGYGWYGPSVSYRTNYGWGGYHYGYSPYRSAWYYGGAPGGYSYYPSTYVSYPTAYPAYGYSSGYYTTGYCGGGFYGY